MRYKIVLQSKNFIALLASLIFLTGCVQSTNLQNNDDPVISISTVTNYRKNQDAYLREFAHLAGNFVKDEDGESYLIGDSMPATSWESITVAGWNYVDHQCKRYLQQLYLDKKRLDGLRRGTNAIGNTTNSILGITGVSSVPIAVTAAAFGLTSTAFDITDDTLLTVIDYNSLAQFVARTQFQYRSLRRQIGISSRVDVVDSIQGYIMLCEQNFIEANINNQIQSGDNLAFYINSGVLPAPKDEAEAQVFQQFFGRPVGSDEVISIKRSVGSGPPDPEP